MKALSRVIPVPLWPNTLRQRAAAMRRAWRGRPRRRPDVTVHFTVTLVLALAGIALILGEFLHLGLPLKELLPFVVRHPLSYLGAFCVALLVVLLAIGDV